ncbi:uncharacterized protein METZ01_LOCUS6539 [marine metagenome]|uniref:Uncharacterized protein n=1 Tax=marine metagenome TaxID=408172 RepID=A0A381NGH3_9ZZZZ
MLCGRRVSIKRPVNQSAHGQEEQRQPKPTGYTVGHSARVVHGGLARELAPTTVKPDINDGRRYEIARQHPATISMPVGISRTRD